MSKHKIDALLAPFKGLKAEMFGFIPLAPDVSQGNGTDLEFYSVDPHFENSLRREGEEAGLDEAQLERLVEVVEYLESSNRK